MNDEIKTAIATVEIGDLAEEFMKSKLGRYLQGASDQDKQLALEQLGKVNPADTESIIALQIKASSAEGAIQWLKEAILMGQQAELEIINMESETDD